MLQHCKLAGTVAVQTHRVEWFSLQANADASLAAGAVNPTTIRQGLLGFNGRNLLQDPVVKVCLLKVQWEHKGSALAVHVKEMMGAVSALMMCYSVASWQAP